MNESPLPHPLPTAMRLPRGEGTASREWDEKREANDERVPSPHRSLTAMGRGRG